ncbi:MAG: type I-B CRISPR-associated protein Cas8b1/Cst1 [bacterium]
MSIYQKLMGNPFVDAGVSAMCEWLDKEPEDITRTDIENLINELTPVLSSPNWKKNIMIIFTINHPIPSPGNQKKDIEAIFKKYLINYLNTIENIGLAGDCAGCGRRPALHSLTKDKVPLTGSGNLRNFFPIFGDGAGYCSACALAIQFLPFVLVSTGGKFLMLHSNSERVLRYWAKRCIEEIRKQRLENDLKGCFSLGYANPHNGLFAMTQELMSRYELRWSKENATMQIYCFSNENRGPELDIFLLPADVFRFLAYVYERQFQSAWKEIVRSGYSKVNWSKVKSEDEYKNHTNRVYENLLENKSILEFFINRFERLAIGSWELIELYLSEVRNMDKERLSTIKRVGDSIAESIERSNNLRRLSQLERAKSYRDCRNVLRFIIKDRIAQGQEEKLFTIDEYAEHLFPDTSEYTEWSETRDLLLFRIYEKLHNWLISRKDEITKESPEEMEEENV